MRDYKHVCTQDAQVELSAQICAGCLLSLFFIALVGFSSLF